MATINLLPWREQVREQRKKYFFISLAAVSVLSGLLVVGVHFIFAKAIKNQKYINNLYKSEIAELDTRIAAIKSLKEKRAQLLTRISIIQQLVSSRPLTVRFFEQLVKVIPDGVYLTEVQRDGQQIVITGGAESNTRVSALMRNINESPWLYAPLLTEIKTDKSQSLHRHHFELRMHQGPNPIKWRR